MLLQPLEADADEEARRHDPVGIDVGAAKRKRAPLHLRDRLPAGARRAKVGQHQFTYSRTSTTLPATAAAATIAGLISSVRPVGLPCRPLKFLLEDEAQICRPSSLSWFIARHIEQPAPRHSKPASVKTRSRPSRSAAARTACEPGTTSAWTCVATR